MFTELSDMQADGRRGVIRGILLLPTSAFYLIVFSVPLVTLYHMGAFTDDSITQTASYLAVMASPCLSTASTPTFRWCSAAFGKWACSPFVTLVASLANIGIIACAAWGVQNNLPATIELIAAGTIASYLIGDRGFFSISSQAFREDGPRLTLLSCLRGFGSVSQELQQEVAVLWNFFEASSPPFRAR